MHQEPQASITAAPTCTEGPSRPMDAPANMPKNVSGIFKAVRHKATKRLPPFTFGIESVANTCGIPLPAV